MRVDHPSVASDKFVGRKDVMDGLGCGVAICKELDTSVSMEEIKEQVEEAKGVDVDKLVADAIISAEEDIKKVDELNLDQLFTGQKQP